MKRFLALFVTVLVAWLAACLSADASAVIIDPRSAPRYDYNEMSLSAPPAHTKLERGSSSAESSRAAAPAVDRWSRGSWVSSNEVTLHAIYPYDHHGLLASAAPAPATAQERVGPSDGDLSPREQVGFATNTADHVLPIGPASEKAWTVLNRIDAKGAPLPGYKGESIFKNSQGKLPETPGVTYREWVVIPTPRASIEGLSESSVAQ